MVAAVALEQPLRILSLVKNQVLFRQGAKGEAAYIVNSGAIGLYREAKDRKVPIATLRAGQLFGEMAVIDGSPRMATAFAVEDSTLTVVPAAMLLLSAWYARGYPLTRAAHERILHELAARERTRTS